MAKIKAPADPIKIAFEEIGLHLPIVDIVPLRIVSPSMKQSVKYAQIAASVREIGIIEPPVVARDKSEPGKYLLLDGHLRLEALKDLEADTVCCLISTDDEAFTYNKRVNRLATVQEHKMIVKAIERGVPEERIAKALNIDASTLRQKKYVLSGICPEAIKLLRDKFIATHTFSVLKKMKPLRQVEAAELMVAMNKYSISYAMSLLAATPQDQLAEPYKRKKIKGVTDEQIALMERETGNLEREFRIAEQSYGTDHLDLVLAKGFIGKLLRNARIVRFLAQNHSGILAEFQKMSEPESTPPNGDVGLTTAVLRPRGPRQQPTKSKARTPNRLAPINSR